MPEMAPETVLREIARQQARKVRRINLFDTQISAFRSNRSLPIESQPGDAFFAKVTLPFDQYKVELRCNSEYLAVSALGEFDFECFSFNRISKLAVVRKLKFELPEYPGIDVFANCERPNAALQSIFNSEELRRLIRILRFSSGESLHAYQNAIIVYLHAPVIERVLASVEALRGFSGEHLQQADQPVSWEGLPESLQDLVPLVKQWAISDDEHRFERLEAASDDHLRRLVHAVKPHLKEIDGFLDSFGTESIPECGTMLGTLAECCIEAERVLNGRFHKN